MFLNDRHLQKLMSFQTQSNIKYVALFPLLEIRVPKSNILTHIFSDSDQKEKEASTRFEFRILALKMRLFSKVF